MLALLFKILEQLFLRVLKSGYRLTFAGRALNKVTNESWKAPLTKEISITGTLLEHAQCTLGIVPRQLQVFGPSFTKKSSMSKLKSDSFWGPREIEKSRHMMEKMPTLIFRPEIPYSESINVM